MIRPFRPYVEALNDRLLPSASPLAAPAAASSVHAADSVSLELRLQTDRVIYRVGERVLMTVTEMNVGDEAALVGHGCGHGDFWVLQTGVEVWRYSHEPQPTCGFEWLRFEPGESRTLGGSWINRHGLTGRFDVYAQFDGVVSNPVSIVIQSPLALALSTDRKHYRLGQPVRITLTETNVSDQDVRATTADPACDEFRPRIRNREGVVVWDFQVMKLCFATVVLKPGESQSGTVVWDGAPNQPGVQLKPGKYTIDVTFDGLTVATSIRLTRSKS